MTLCIEQSEQKVTSLEVLRVDFHRVDKEKAVLESQLKSEISSEVIFGVCLTVGSLLIGYSPSVWGKPPEGFLLLAFGIILIIGGVAARIIRK